MQDGLSRDRLLALAAINAAEFIAGASPRDQRWADVWAADMSLAAPICNSATLLTPLTETGISDLTARLDAFYGAAHGAGWILWSPWPTPDLTPLGYGVVGQPPIMVRAAGSPPVPVPAGLRVEEIADPALLRTYWQGMIDWYPLKELTPQDASVFQAKMLGAGHRYWIGYEDDQPVTLAMAVVGAELIGVYSVATAPSARGKGYGGTMTDIAARCEPHLPAFLKSSDQPSFAVFQHRHRNIIYHRHLFRRSLRSDHAIPARIGYQQHSRSGADERDARAEMPDQVCCERR